MPPNALATSGSLLALAQRREIGDLIPLPCGCVVRVEGYTGRHRHLWNVSTCAPHRAQHQPLSPLTQYTASSQYWWTDPRNHVPKLAFWLEDLESPPHPQRKPSRLARIGRIVRGRHVPEAP